MFLPTSRYFSIETTKFVNADGSEIVHLRRRFLPNPRTLIVLSEHMVTQGDRLDNVTAEYFADPEQFWRVADANDLMHPAELTNKIGRRLNIPLSQVS